jgi:hypothetical protein
MFSVRGMANTTAAKREGTPQVPALDSARGVRSYKAEAPISDKEGSTSRLRAKDFTSTGCADSTTERNSSTVLCNLNVACRCTTGYNGRRMTNCKRRPSRQHRNLAICPNMCPTCAGASQTHNKRCCTLCPTFLVVLGSVPWVPPKKEAVQHVVDEQISGIRRRWGEQAGQGRPPFPMGSRLQSPLRLRSPPIPGVLSLDSIGRTP